MPNQIWQSYEPSKRSPRHSVAFDWGSIRKKSDRVPFGSDVGSTVDDNKGIQTMKMGPTRHYFLGQNEMVRSQVFELKTTDYLLKRVERLLRQRQGQTLNELADLLDIPEAECRKKLRELLDYGAQIRADRKERGDEYRFRLEGYCMPNIVRGEYIYFPGNDGTSAAHDHGIF